ncbi:hypothetical protein L7F22_008186 [Adiantum nelumboides]|nr:hypothetical protein [Adiantum nelumboides]
MRSGINGGARKGLAGCVCATALWVALCTPSFAVKFAPVGSFQEVSVIGVCKSYNSIIYMFFGTCSSLFCGVCSRVVQGWHKRKMHNRLLHHCQSPPTVSLSTPKPAPAASFPAHVSQLKPSLHLYLLPLFPPLFCRFCRILWVHHHHWPPK